MENFAMVLQIKKESELFNYLLTYADILDAVEEAHKSD